MELIPLKIPRGYAICYNKFCDVEPKESIESDGYLENWHYFTEDILQHIKIELKDGSWYVPEDISLVIDLGWYQDGKVDGNYRPVLA